MGSPARPRFGSQAATAREKNAHATGFRPARFLRREYDALGTSRVCSLTKVHHFPIMPLEFQSRKEENPGKLVRSTLAKLF